MSNRIKVNHGLHETAKLAVPMLQKKSYILLLADARAEASTLIYLPNHANGCAMQHLAEIPAAVSASIYGHKDVMQSQQ